MAADELRCERFEKIYRSIGHHNLLSENPKKLIEAPAWDLAVSLGKTGHFMEWAKKNGQPYLRPSEITEYKVRRYEQDQLQDKYGRQAFEEQGGLDTSSEGMNPDGKDERLGRKLGKYFLGLYKVIMKTDTAEEEMPKFETWYGEYDERAEAEWEDMQARIEHFRDGRYLPSPEEVTERLVMTYVEHYLYDFGIASFRVDVTELIGKPVIDLTNGDKQENGDLAAPSKVVSDDVYHTYDLYRRGDVYVEEIKRLKGWSEMMDYFNKDRKPEPTLPAPKKTSAKRRRKN